MGKQSYVTPYCEKKTGGFNSHNSNQHFPEEDDLEMEAENLGAGDVCYFEVHILMQKV